MQVEIHTFVSQNNILNAEKKNDHILGAKISPLVQRQLVLQPYNTIGFSWSLPEGILVVDTGYIYHIYSTIDILK